MEKYLTIINIHLMTTV